MSLYDEDEDALLPDASSAAAWTLKQPLTTPARLIAPTAAPPTPPASTTTPSLPMSSSLSLSSSSSSLLKPSPKPTASRPTSTLRPALTPVLPLKAKVQSPSANSANPSLIKSLNNNVPSKVRRDERGLLPLHDPQWQPVNEYDPAWPNDYRTVVKEMKGAREAEELEEAANDPEARKRKYAETSKERSRERFHASGFSRIHQEDEEDYEEEDRKEIRDKDEDSDEKFKATGSRSSRKTVGAAIAPPPSLMETSNPSSPSPSASHGLNVAAKIMAKFGYKQGQGLGRLEQGMSQALSVEKTSKRGGRILHEKELPPPMPPLFDQPSPQNRSENKEANEGGDSNMGAFYDNSNENRPSITDLMKNPSKVVLCMNMVGPGEVDHELEPEVADECSSKYGDVVKVLIYEVKTPTKPEEAVRIFIEFKRVESAIKALVGLNGRFFGGREVQARFYDQDKFNDLKLTD